VVLPQKKVKKNLTVKIGSVTVKIYRTPKKGSDFFTVTWYGSEGRERKVFASLTEAEAHARTTAQQLEKGYRTTVSLEEMAELHRAKAILKPFGVSVDLAAVEWAKATTALGGAPFSDVIAFYKLNHAKYVVTVESAVAEFLKAKKQDGAGERHIDDLTSRLNLFAEENPGRLDILDADRCEGWLRGLQEKNKWSGQTRNHYRAALLNFLNFAWRARYISFTPERFAQFAPAAIHRGQVEIFTPAQAEKLLRAAVPRMVPSLVLALFSGLRPSEIHRVKWEGVDVERGYVYGFEGKVRTAGHRLAHLPPNAIQWLKPFKANSPADSLLCDYDCLSNRFLFLAKEAELKWIHDGPRHSYVSYRLAILGDIARVSEETGTNMTTLRKHYRRPVPKEEAEKYFAIVP
jgi:integrase